MRGAAKGCCQFAQLFAGGHKPKWRNGRRDGLKNRWGATLVSVRIRPSAPQREGCHAATNTGCYGGFSLVRSAVGKAQVGQSRHFLWHPLRPPLAFAEGCGRKVVEPTR